MTIEPHFVLRAFDGYYWQTSRGFLSREPESATKYRDRTEAAGVRAFCCPTKAKAEIVEVKP